MGLPRATSFSGSPRVRAPDLGGSPIRGHGYHGHRHFWHRARTRRAVIQAAGGLALASVAATRWDLVLAQDTGAAMPKPIAGGGFEIEGELLHVYDYIPGNEPSTIGDFRGLVAINGCVQKSVTSGEESGGVSCRVCPERDARPGRRPPWR
jgi:hypothetical protein